MMRYLLDTVTISELRHSDHKIHSSVKNWQLGIGAVWLSVITLNELRFGIMKVAKKDAIFAANLTLWYSQIIAQPKRFRVLNVDRSVAEQAADFRAAYDTPFEDSLIAATAKVHSLTLATRNTADFKNTGIQLVNPWEFNG